MLFRSVRVWMAAVAITAMAVLACGSAVTTSRSSAQVPSDTGATVSIPTGRQAAASPGRTQPASSVPRFAHVVVVVEENRSYAEVIGRSSAPYLNSLAAGGALFTQSYAVAHPSEPNYLALFSGSTHGLSSDVCPQTYTTQNLGSELIHAGLSFAGYSESMPSTGYTGCTSGGYARKHNPWVDFPSTVPAADNRTLGAFPANYSSLPTVSFVIPNEYDNMHSGSVAAGDSWLKAHLASYAQWAKTHNSLLIVTWDEDDTSADNHIPTIFYGQAVKIGRYSQRLTHYGVLHTLQDAYGLPTDTNSSNAVAITDVWQ